MESVVSASPAAADLDEIVSRAAPMLRTLEGRCVLIAGAGGFLGAYLALTLAHANDTLLATPCRALLVDSFVTGLPDRLRSLTERQDCEIVRASLTELPPLTCDVVVHAASIASPVAYRRLPLETIDVNVRGTWALLELARVQDIQSLLFLSSSEVYGDPEGRFVPTAEDYVGRVSFTGPRACYDESKRLGETLCRVYFEQHRVRVKVARPFNVYGPGMRLDDGRVVPDLIRQGLDGGPLVLHSDGTPTRSFCYATDATVAFFALLASSEDGEAFNVGTPEEVSMDHLAREIGTLFGVDEVVHRPASDSNYLVGNPQRRCPDVTKIASRVGWRPSVTLADGLRRTVDAYALERA